MVPTELFLRTLLQDQFIEEYLWHSPAIIQGNYQLVPTCTQKMIVVLLPRMEKKGQFFTIIEYDPRNKYTSHKLIRIKE
jgi:hypothetical protein